LDLILKTEPQIAVCFITTILEQKQTILNYDLYLEYFVKFLIRKFKSILYKAI